MVFAALFCVYMDITKLKTESQTINRKPHSKVTKLPYLGTEQLGQGATCTLLGWPKSIYYNGLFQKKCTSPNGWGHFLTPPLTWIS